MRRVPSAIPVLLLAATAAVAAVSACAGSEPSKPATTPAPATTTVTTQPSAPASPPASPSTPASPRPTGETPTADAASTVEAYYDAINARDYRRAWDLGGRNFNSSFESFAAGYADTAHVTVNIRNVRGPTVSVLLVALQRDGSLKSFGGTYTVRAGELVSAAIREVSPPAPFYENCDAARRAGVAPLDRDDPGYAPHLDRDNDGIGCEDDED